MKLYYAHYPALEDQFVRLVTKHRQNPTDKWGIICASSWLGQQLQTRLARELGAVANIHFITASGLVARLDSEAPGPTLPLLPQNHVRDYLIKNLLTQPGLDRYPLSHGFVQVVKSALRDMEDSLVTPDVLEEHLQSMPDFVLEQDGGRLEWLVRLYQKYIEQTNKVPGYRPYQNAFERALKQAESSPYLQSFSHLIIYGFYDMTGRQWELISRLRACYPVTVFAPYEKHPAYQFAKKFFESNWLSAPGAQDANTPFTGALGASAKSLFASGGSAPNTRVHIVSVPHISGAVFYTAKEILKELEKGTHPADIAVIVRNLAPYQDEIRRTFEANCLPLNASFTYPFTKYALGNFCLNLLGLATSGFSRENVLAVFASPYFKQADKTAWRHLVQQSAVKRDLAQWQDLLPSESEFTPAVQAWVTKTARALEQLNKAQAWQTGAQAVWKFLQEQIDESAFEGKDREIFQAIETALQDLQTYEVVRKTGREGELLKETAEAISSLTFNEVQAISGGITVTDALRARGLQFKTVFVLGLNDQEFPLITPEDPILRDYYRYQLRDTLGYWINASLDRADEEKLLFYNAVTCARENLHVCYARYGQNGKPAVPSVYVAELARVCELNLQADNAPRLSGRLSEQLANYSTTLFTPKEVSCQMALRPNATANYRVAGLLTPPKERALRAAAALAGAGALNHYDGIITSGPEIFARENARGFSPSALQEVGACPLKYFFNRALHLGEPDEPASRCELPADKRGSAYHEILHDFYQTLLEKNLTHTLFDDAVATYMAQSITKFYTPRSYRAFGIYPVVWEMILENIRQKLTDFATQDVAQLGPFTPTVFEQEVSATFPDLPIKLRGIIDRVDVDPAARTFYVVDYKSSRKGSKLAQDFFTQLILQPFVYLLLAPQLPQLQGCHPAGACLAVISPYKKNELSAQDFQAMHAKACAFLTRLTDLVKHGTFFMNPSELCTYCPYTLLCRKDAFKPLLRARKSAQAHALEEARP